MGLALRCYRDQRRRLESRTLPPEMGPVPATVAAAGSAWVVVPERAVGALILE